MDDPYKSLPFMKYVPLLFIPLFILTDQAAAQVRLGAKAGISSAKAYASPWNFGESATREYYGEKAIPAFYAGLIADIRCGRSPVYFQPALVYAGRGGKSQTASIDQAQSNYNGRGIYRLHTVELHTNMLLKFPLGDGKIFGGGGTFVGYCFSGTFKETNPGAPERVMTKQARIGKYKENLPAVSLGINVLVGYEFLDRWQGAVNYNMSGYEEQGRYLAFSVGYFFRK